MPLLMSFLCVSWAFLVTKNWQWGLLRQVAYGYLTKMSYARSVSLMSRSREPQRKSSTNSNDANIFTAIIAPHRMYVVAQSFSSMMALQPVQPCEPLPELYVNSSL